MLRRFCRGSETLYFTCSSFIISSRSALEFCVGCWAILHGQFQGQCGFASIDIEQILDGKIVLGQAMGVGRVLGRLTFAMR